MLLWDCLFLSQTISFFMGFLQNALLPTSPLKFSVLLHPHVLQIYLVVNLWMYGGKLGLLTWWLWLSFEHTIDIWCLCFFFFFKSWTWYNYFEELTCWTEFDLYDFFSCCLEITFILYLCSGYLSIKQVSYVSSFFFKKKIIMDVVQLLWKVSMLNWNSICMISYHVVLQLRLYYSHSWFYVLCIILFTTFLSGTMPIYCLNVLHPLIQWHTFKFVMACLGKSFSLF